MPDTAPRWTRLIRPQDFVWVLLFGSADRHGGGRRRIGNRAARRARRWCRCWSRRSRRSLPRAGRIFWMVLKLALALPADRIHRRDRPAAIGWCCCCRWFRRPRISACWARCCSALRPCVAYLSFLLFVDWTRFTVDWPEIKRAGLSGDVSRHGRQSREPSGGGFARCNPSRSRLSGRTARRSQPAPAGSRGSRAPVRPAGRARTAFGGPGA